MLQHPTLDRLNAMGLAGMARAFDELAANAEAERGPCQPLGGIVAAGLFDFYHLSSLLYNI